MPFFRFVTSQCTRLTNRRTDRHRILIARPHLHSMQRGKNGEKIANPTNENRTKNSMNNIPNDRLHLRRNEICSIYEIHKRTNTK